MIGRIVSIKTKNTVVVLVERRKTHPLYKKSFLRSKKYLVDDVIGTSLGDRVEILETRPISKRKHWKVVKILGKDLVALGEETMKEIAREAIEEVLGEELEEEEIKGKREKETKGQREKEIGGKEPEKPIESKEPKEIKVVKKGRGSKMKGEEA